MRQSSSVFTLGMGKCSFGLETILRLDCMAHDFRSVAIIYSTLRLYFPKEVILISFFSNATLVPIILCGKDICCTPENLCAPFHNTELLPGCSCSNRGCNLPSNLQSNMPMCLSVTEDNFILYPRPALILICSSPRNQAMFSKKRGEMLKQSSHQFIKLQFAKVDKQATIKKVSSRQSFKTFYHIDFRLNT